MIKLISSSAVEPAVFGRLCIAATERHMDCIGPDSCIFYV